MTRTALRSFASRSILGACLVGAAAMPPWIEGRGRAAIASAWACEHVRTCGALGDVDLHMHGISIGEAWREVDGWRVAMQRLTVALHDGVVEVRASGVTVARAEPSRPQQSRVRGASLASAPPRPRTVPSTLGLPVTITIDDSVQVAGPRGSAITVQHAGARLDGAGGLTLEADVTVQHAALAEPSRVRARATAIEGDLDRWHAEADVTLRPQEEALRMDATIDGETRQLRAWAPGGGAITVRPLGRRGVLVAAQAFPVDAIVGAWQIAPVPAEIDIEEATISGTIEAHLDEHPRVHLTELQVDGVVIDDARVARTPMRLDGLRIAGDMGLLAGGGFADIVLARGDAELALSASLDSDQIALSLELPEHECQALLDALPGAMKDTLGGMRMDGRIEGHVRLSIDRSALADARTGYGGEPGEVPPQPGELDLSLPVLEACTVTADPAAIDLDALLGPYRHHFATASGDARTRTLAPGAPGFAPLSTVQLVADAFVTLEDRRFFAHDGFDREQMHNALWHNVVRGGVHRGASTISQQATRNLWLGVDRSLARKLQEALLTARLEAEVPKPRILELYLNVIELGPDVHGVEAAAQYWFGKPAAELDVREAVHLAALAPAPRRFARRFASGEVDAAWDEMLDRQIRRMWLAGRITGAARDRGLRASLRIVPH